MTASSPQATPSGSRAIWRPSRTARPSPSPYVRRRDSFSQNPVGRRPDATVGRMGGPNRTCSIRSSSGRTARREHILREPESELARGRVPIQRGHEDALCGRPEEPEDQPIDGSNRDPYDEADDATDQTAHDEEQDPRQCEQDEDHPECEVSTRGLAPRLPKQGPAPLDGRPRSGLLEDQDRDDEIGRDAPSDTREPGDDASDDAETFGDGPEDQSDGRAHERPSRDPLQVLIRDFQAVRNRRVSAVQSDHGGAHDRRVEVDRHEERDVVHYREADVEEPIPEWIRRSRGEEEDRDQEDEPGRARQEQRQERQDDKAFLLPQDPEADLRQLPANAEAFEKSELARRHGERTRPSR